GRLSAAHGVVAEVSVMVGIELAWSRTENDQVLENVSGRSGLNLAHGLRIAPETLSQIHAAVIAEGIDRHTGARVHLLQVTVDGKYKPSIGPVFTFPVIDAAIGGRSVHDRMRPD